MRPDTTKPTPTATSERAVPPAAVPGEAEATGAAAPPPDGATPRPLAPLEGAYVDAAATPFSWRPVPGAAGYRLQIAPVRDFSRDVIEVEAGPTGSLTLHDTLPVSDGADLFWRVGVAGSGAWSRPGRFRPASDEAVAAFRAEEDRGAAERAKAEAERRARLEAEDDLVPFYMRESEVINGPATATYLILFAATFLAVIFLLMIVGTTG